MLFNATLDRMSAEDLEILVSQHQAQRKFANSVSLSRRLTCLVHSIGSQSTPTGTKDDEAHSLLMIGAIALHKYQSVNPS